MPLSNLFAGIPSHMTGEIIDTLATSGALRIERIVSRGHVSPPDFWYDQAEHEWVMLLQGEASLRFESGNRLVGLKAGDCIEIRPHERHRVESTSDCGDTIWLAVFYD